MTAETAGAGSVGVEIVREARFDRAVAEAIKSTGESSQCLNRPESVVIEEESPPPVLARLNERSRKSTLWM
jgi:hypothetical protein